MRENPNQLYLQIEGCPGLESLPLLPRRLVSLSIQNCPALESIDALPGSLKSLQVYGCAGVKSLFLPDGLLHLLIRDCPGMAGEEQFNV